MKLTRVVPAVAAMAMLAACSPTAGTALVAGGQTVTEADLTRMTESCTQIVGQEIARADIVKILIMGSVFDELAVSAGQDVTEDQIAQMAVANGMTGRAQPVAGAPAADGAPAANPRFEKADAALEAGDFARAVEEFDALLKETPNDVEALAGRAQVALLARSMSFDPEAIVARASVDPNDVEAQLDAADLEVINGRSAEALDRLLGLAAESSPEDRDRIRVRLLELFEIIGRTDPVVLKARRRLATVLF